MACLTATSRISAARRAARGFTFVEVLATMALLAAVLPPVMSGISLCLSAGKLSEQQAQAASLCQDKLSELVTNGQWQHGNQSGDCSPDWPDYRWASQVVDWDGTVLQQLEVTVTWQFRRQDHSVTLTTLIYTGPPS